MAGGNGRTGGGRGEVAEGLSRGVRASLRCRACGPALPAREWPSWPAPWPFGRTPTPWPHLPALQPWNVSHALSGDLEKRMDPYFPFGGRGGQGGAGAGLPCSFSPWCSGYCLSHLPACRGGGSPKAAPRCATVMRPAQLPAPVGALLRRCRGCGGCVGALLRGAWDRVQGGHDDPGPVRPRRQVLKR